MTRSRPEEIRIAHFSDLHLVPEERVPLWTLLGKRALGFANLTLNRGRTHKREYLERLLLEVAAEGADYVVVTGDLTSLSLDFEFARIDRLFRDAGLSPDRTMVLPGNHDRYTPTADLSNAFEKCMADWFPDHFSRPMGYPLAVALGPVVLYGLDTAVCQGPVRAAGAIAESQIGRLAADLTSERHRRKWPVIALHHPPFHRGNRHLLHYRTGLSGYEKLIHALGDRPATLVHGHLHAGSRFKVGPLDVIGVPSASNNTGEPDTQLAYNVYTFSKDGLARADLVRLWPEADRVERLPLPEATPLI
jgi:3',5'-cyclic AMP phosphodiesterase CpdA